MRKLLFSLKRPFSNIESLNPILPSLNFLDLFKLKPKPLESLDFPSKKLAPFLNNPSIINMTMNEIETMRLELLIQCDFLLKNPQKISNNIDFPLQLLKSSINLDLSLEKFLIILKISLESQKQGLSIIKITQVLLELQESLKKNLEFLMKNVSFNEILAILSNSLKTRLLQEKSLEKTSNSGLFLLQILYIFVRFDYSDEKLYRLLLPEIRKTNSLGNLLEIQLTSLILSLCRLEKKFPDVLAEKPEFFKALEEKILHRIKEDSLVFSRIPHILHCFAVLARKPEKTRDFLIENLEFNIEKLTNEEIGSLIYSVFRLELEKDREIGLKLLEKFRDFIRKTPEKVTVVELMNALIAMRSWDPIKKTEVLELLIEKFEVMSQKSKFVFLYEIIIKQRLFNKEKFKDSPFERFSKEISLEKLNNFDFLTIATIINEMRDGKNMEFEIVKILENIEKRGFSKELEKNRAFKLKAEILRKNHSLKRKAGFLMKKPN